jgi:hypothetical protein
LNRDKPAVVHFAGHGSGPDGLLFHGENGVDVVVSGEVLKVVFATAGPELRLVLLNACFSHEQAPHIAEVVDCCIGMTDEIADDAATAFSAAFYRAVGYGRSVGNAFQQGVARLKLLGPAEEQLPVLVCKPAVNADAVVLVSASIPQTNEPRRLWRIRLFGVFLDFGVADQDSFLAKLMGITGDQSAKIEEVLPGSVRVFVRMTDPAAERLKSLAGSEHLDRALGYRLLDVIPWKEEDFHHEARKQMSGPEVSYVEQPFIDQLVSMGWKHTTGNLDFPSATGRESFRDVLLLNDLRTALHRINLDPQGQPWLDNGRLGQAVSALTKLGPSKLLEANQAATEVLLKGTGVDGVEGWEKGRTRTVHFIDWGQPGEQRVPRHQPVSRRRAGGPGQEVHDAGPGVVLQRHPAGGR